jgi:O-antigen/teichoic acid export membrane protein
MVKKFFKDSALYGVATILSKGLTVLMVPIYTAYLTKQQIGLLDLMLGAISVISLVIGLDISNALAREYGEGHGAGHRQRYSSTSLWFTVVVFAVALLLAQVWAVPLAQQFLGDGGLAPIVRAAAVTMGISGVYLVVSQQLRWMMLPGKFGIVSVTFTLVSLGLTVLLVGPGSMGATGVLYGTAAGAGVGLLLSLWYARGEFSWTVDLSGLRKMLKFCIPIVPSSLAVVVNQYVARYVIEGHLGRESVGVFGVGVRLAGLAGLVMLGFGSALTPLVYAGEHDPATPRHLARIFRIFMALATLGLGGLALFTQEILKLLTRADYTAVAPLITCLAPAFLLTQMYIFAPGAWIKRRMWWVAGTNVLTALLAMGLNWLLVSRMGLMGAAVATLLSAAVHFGLSMLVSQLMYPVPHQWLRLFWLSLTGAGMMVAATFLPQEITIWNFLLKVGLWSLLAGGVIYSGHEERAWLSRAWSKVSGRGSKGNCGGV